MIFRMDVMMLSVLGEFDDDQIENKDGFQIGSVALAFLFAPYIAF